MNIYSYLITQSTNGKQVLATIVKTRGSTPQVSGASAVFSKKGLVYGTIGGGILENTVNKLAAEAASTGRSQLLEYNLDAEITDKTGAICGGSSMVLIDAQPLQHREVFSAIDKVLAAHRRCILCTKIQKLPGRGISIMRYCLQESGQIPEDLKDALKTENIWSLFTRRDTLLIKNSSSDPEETLFIEPILPMKTLFIIGAGHVGQALCHMASLIDFEVTVMDDRPEFAQKNRFPDAKQVICGNIEDVLEKMFIDAGTHIVIVTHGHIHDAIALKQCIHRGAAYIGMIGSRRKIRLVKDKFISNHWATKADLDAIHAPVGLDIDAESVQEIAMSIAAELVKVSRSGSRSRKGISIIVLAAGLSKRMGKPKMLLPYANSTIIETVVGKAIHSKADHVSVVTGGHGPEIRKKLSRFPINIITNDQYESGMLSSVLAGIRSIPQHVKAAMILLGDQPMIQTEVINQLIEAYNAHAERIVIPVYNGKRGHPLIVDMSFKREIENLDPEKGLRQMIINNPEEVKEIEVNTPSILKDIDTKEDYAKMKEWNEGIME